MVTSEKFEHEGVLGFKFGYGLIGKPHLYVHMYYVDGLLIDAGPSKTKKATLAATRELPIKNLVLTHHHEDHTGNIPALTQQHSCDVYASSECISLMKAPPPLSLIQKLTWGERPACTSIRALGNTLLTREHEFQVIPVPGHASDMIALYEPHRKWLFSADLYINSYIGYFLDNESIKAQISSIQTVLELDFNTLFCSHKPQFAQPKEGLKKKLDYFQTIYSKTESLHRQGHSDKEIFKILELQEDRIVKWLSGGKLSKLNMIKTIIQDLDNPSGHS